MTCERLRFPARGRPEASSRAAPAPDPDRKTYALLREHGVALVIGDHPERPFQELDDLRSEREQLETELTIARRWVHTLARELELADLQLKEARPLYSHIGRPPRPELVD